MEGSFFCGVMFFSLGNPYVLRNTHLTLFWAIVILLLPFIVVPGLGDIDKAGKLFVFIFAVLLVGLLYITNNSGLKFSQISAVLVLLLGLFLASSAQAFSPFWAFIQTFIFASFVIYLIILTDYTFKNPDFINYFMSVLLLFGLLAAILGLYEYISFVSMGPSGSMLIPFLLPPNMSIRIAGIFGQPNLFALYLTTILLAYGYYYIHADFKIASKVISILRFLPFFIIALVFFLTGSRAGLLSLSLVWGFIIWLAVSRRYLAENMKGRKELYFLVLCLFFAKVVSLGLNGCLSPEAIRSFSEVGMSADARFVFWMSAVLMFLDNTILGVGLGNYEFLQSFYGPASHKLLGFVPYEAMVSTDWAHNELLQILCEGGFFAFFLLICLLFLFLWKIKINFIDRNSQTLPVFLYSHLLLLPFIIQSMFSWPLRSPPLLVLFFTFLATLLAQYPLKDLSFSLVSRKVVAIFFLLGAGVTAILFFQEIRIGDFKRSFSGNHQIENTLETFDALASHPYSSYRVLNKALPVYARRALSEKGSSLAQKILPYYEKLSLLEGARWQWYDLARLYLKVGREEAAGIAIQRAITLMPSDTLPWAFQHYLNMLKASRETGRSLESFFPRGKKIDFNVMELMDE